MTDALSAARRAELVHKVVRVHALRDPLAAMGQRHPAERVERESRARRGLFAAALASFVACFGTLTLTSPQPKDVSTDAPVPNIVAEIPLNDDRGTTLRIVQPAAVTPQTHVRTRAS